MKTKKVLYLCLLAMGLCIFPACNDQDGHIPEKNNKKVPLQIETNLRVSETSTPIKTRSAVAVTEIGLFITTGNLGYYYDGQDGFRNVRYNCLDNTFSKDVFLSSNNAKIYAYYPYKDLGFDCQGENIPINLSDPAPVDFLYGTHMETINNGNPVCHLQLKHALTPILIRFKRVNYTGKGLLTKVELCNGNEKHVIRRTGSINIQTGLITSNPRYLIDLSKEVNYTIPKDFTSDENQYTQFLIIPVGTTVESDGDVFARFTIDGKEYTYLFPAGTTWNPDTKYTYSISLTGKKLINDIQIKELAESVTGEANIGE